LPLWSVVINTSQAKLSSIMKETGVIFIVESKA